MKEKMILQIIYNNNIEDAKQINFNKQNLNFAIYFTEVDLDDKITPLVLASYLGRIELVKMCLSNSAIDIDYGSEPNDITALIAACMSSNFEIMKLLIETGSEVNKPS